MEGLCPLTLLPNTTTAAKGFWSRTMLLVSLHCHANVWLRKGPWGSCSSFPVAKTFGAFFKLFFLDLCYCMNVFIYFWRKVF